MADIEIEVLSQDSLIIESTSTGLVEIGLSNDTIETVAGTEISVSLENNLEQAINLVERGPQGYSAYEVAVRNGFTGTEEEWLSTLGGSDDYFKQYFEYYSKNLQSYPFSIQYESDKISSITYDTGSQEVIKTFNYTLGILTSIVLSGGLPQSLSLRTKELVYTDGALTSCVYS